MATPRIEMLPGVPIPVLRCDPHPCPYLPDRQACEVVALTHAVDAETYQKLMDNGFRRSANIFYRPKCPGCEACRPIRVPVARFAPSRSQRRVQRRNADVVVRTGPVIDDDERWALFQKYQHARHDGELTGARDAFSAVLGNSSLETIEMTYRVDGRLVGVGIVDITPVALSSMYFYYDPDYARRSLGVFSGLCEIDECRRRKRAWWYIGFHIAGCPKMVYKARYRPYELLGTDDVWHRHE